LIKGQGRIIARRSISLSKTYPILGVLLGLIAVLLSGLSGALGGLPLYGVSANGTSAASAGFSPSLPLISISLQVLAAIIFATPVLLLYVYDKNNGTLEYLLSLGMDQGDVYKQYLKAALILASGLVGFEVAADVVGGLVGGLGVIEALEISGVVVALSLPVVSFGTLIMMSFSSLQKQRVGSNQPLGLAISVFLIMPAYVASLVLPSIAFEVDLLLAGLIVVLASLMFLASSRLISREKLLP
jgi:hypothetical protein